MLRQKKISNPAEEEPLQRTGKEKELIEFYGVIANALSIGLTKKEIEKMRLGEFADIFDAHKLIHNMKMEHRIYKMPEKRVSMLDL